MMFGNRNVRSLICTMALILALSLHTAASYVYTPNLCPTTYKPYCDSQGNCDCPCQSDDDCLVCPSTTTADCNSNGKCNCVCQTNYDCEGYCDCPPNSDPSECNQDYNKNFKAMCIADDKEEYSKCTACTFYNDAFKTKPSIFVLVMGISYVLFAVKLQ